MNKLFVISGPSGAGKGTLTRRLVRHGGAVLAVSHTTRSPRPEEENGLHYHFVSKKVFQEMIDRKEFLEWAQYPPPTGNYYGMSLAETNRDGAILLEIEIQGARQVRAARPDATLIFIAPPDFTTLERRIIERGGVSKEDLRLRLTRAKEEMVEGPKLFDHLIVNRDGDEGLEQAFAELCDLVRA